MFLQLLQVARNVPNEFFVQASKVIAFDTCIAECDSSLDDVFEFAGIGETSVFADDFKEQSCVASCYLELGQEIIQNGFCNFLQVVLRVSVEINNGIETAGERLVKMLEKVCRCNDGDLLVEVVEAFEDCRCGAAHFAKVLRIGSVKCDGVNFVKQHEDFFWVCKVVQLVEKCGDVLLRLAEFAVDDGVEIHAEQVAFQDASDLPDRFGLARSGGSLEQEFVDAHVPLDGVDDSENVFFDGSGEWERFLRRAHFLEKGHLVFVHLWHKGVRARHKGHDVF